MEYFANIKKRISLNQSTLAKGYPGGRGYGGYGKTGVFGSWLDGRQTVHYCYSGWGSEDEVFILYGHVLLYPGEGKLGQGSIHLFETHPFDRTCRRYAQRQQLDPLCHPFGHARDTEA